MQAEELKNWNVRIHFKLYITCSYWQFVYYTCSGARSLHGVCDGHSPRCLSFNQGCQQPRRERGAPPKLYFSHKFSFFSFVRFYAWDLGMVLSAVLRQHMFVEMECFRSFVLVRCFDDAGMLLWPYDGEIIIRRWRFLQIVFLPHFTFQLHCNHNPTLKMVTCWTLKISF